MESSEITSEEAAEDNMELLDFVASDDSELEVEANNSEQQEEEVDPEESVLVNDDVDLQEVDSVQDIGNEIIAAADEEVVQHEAVESKDSVDEQPKVSDKNTPIADQYQSKRGVLGERTEAIADVRKAISITDRFLYLKELFNNNMDLFNDALDEINKASSMHEAASYLGQFNWEDNETSQQFMRLVSRRFL